MTISVVLIVSIPGLVRCTDPVFVWRNSSK